MLWKCCFEVMFWEWCLADVEDVRSEVFIAGVYSERMVEVEDTWQPVVYTWVLAPSTRPCDSEKE
jgi:hypothetical protein